MSSTDTPPSAVGTVTGRAGTGSAGTSGVGMGRFTSTVGLVDVLGVPSAAMVAVGSASEFEGSSSQPFLKTDLGLALDHTLRPD